MTTSNISCILPRSFGFALIDQLLILLDGLSQRGVLYRFCGHHIGGATRELLDMLGEVREVVKVERTRCADVKADVNVAFIGVCASCKRTEEVGALDGGKARAYLSYLVDNELFIVGNALLFLDKPKRLGYLLLYAGEGAILSLVFLRLNAPIKEMEKRVGFAQAMFEGKLFDRAHELRRESQRDGGSWPR